MTKAENIADKVVRQAEAGIRLQRKQALETAMNLAFLDGKQSVGATMQGGLQEYETEWNDEEIDNRMIKVFRWWMRKMFKTKPVITVFGGGEEIVDHRRAKVASKLMDHLKEHNGWKEAEKEAGKWVFNSGAAYIAPVWRKNPMLHKRRKVYESREEPEEEGGRYTFRPHREEEYFDKDIAFDVYAASQVIQLPLNARCWQDVEALITMDVVTKEWIERHLGEEISSGIEPLPEDDNEYDRIKSVMRYVESDQGYLSADIEGEDAEKYLLVQKRERPTFKRPNGRFIVIVGDRVIYDKDLPYIDEARECDPQDSFNLSMGLIPWFSMPFPGKLTPPAPASLLRPYQTRLNELRTDISMNRRTVGRNKLIMHEGALADDSGWTNEHGEKVLINPGHELPQITQGQPLQGVYQELAAEERSFDGAAGRSGIMQGENQPQVRGAWHLQILYEEAVEDISLDIVQREMNHQMVGRLVLGMIRRRYTEERVINIYGRERIGDALLFMNSHLVNDFVVEEGSALPRNKSSIEAQVVELWSRNAFVDEQGRPDVDSFWRMLELGTANRSVSDRQKHILHAEEEFDVMIHHGELRYPEQWEPHDIHMQVFDYRRAEPEFRNAPVDRQNLVNAHHDMHANIWAEQNAPPAMTGGEMPGGIIEGAAEQAAAGGEGRGGRGQSAAPVGGPGDPGVI